ncbi:MAG: hypothetical protein QG622_11 [Actinomycetota bacterium]|nr:hypothetical protein [Actinomycetota bacterium]
MCAGAVAIATVMAHTDSPLSANRVHDPVPTCRSPSIVIRGSSTYVDQSDSQFAITIHCGPLPGQARWVKCVRLVLIRWKISVEYQHQSSMRSTPTVRTLMGTHVIVDVTLIYTDRISTHGPAKGMDL